MLFKYEINVEDCRNIDIEKIIDLFNDSYNENKINTVSYGTNNEKENLNFNIQWEIDFKNKEEACNYQYGFIDIILQCADFLYHTKAPYLININSDDENSFCVSFVKIKED